jgi:hypothetical protein
MGEYKYNHSYALEEAKNGWRTLVEEMLPLVCGINTHEWFSPYYQSCLNELREPLQEGGRRWMAWDINEIGARHRYLIEYKIDSKFHVSV